MDYIADYKEVCGKKEDGVVDLQRLLKGHLDNLPPLPARAVRVFLSSTFSDMIQERNALMESVYPKLKNFCREKYRLEFQVIDLRWGLRDQSQDDHTIVEFCIKEIENCLKSSVGPSFVALLGQKYGYRSFPARIPGSQFEMICEELKARSRDLSLLMLWYKKDSNVIPPIYTLQPISTNLPNYINKINDELRIEAENEWYRVFNELLMLLREGAQACYEKGLLPLRDRNLYFISVTEYEIEEGLLTVADPLSTTFCITRHIGCLEDSIHCKRAPKFIDIRKDDTTGESSLDNEAQDLLKVLRQEKIPTIYLKTPTSSVSSPPITSSQISSLNHLKTPPNGDLTDTQNSSSTTRRLESISEDETKQNGYLDDKIDSLGNNNTTNKCSSTNLEDGVCTTKDLEGGVNGPDSVQSPTCELNGDAVFADTDIDHYTDTPTGPNDAVNQDDVEHMNESGDSEATPSAPLTGRSTYSYRVSSPNLHHFSIKWLLPEWDNPTHNQNYLDKFCETFEERMKTQISECMEGRFDSARNSKASEVHQHLMMCKARCDLFRGRQDVLEKARQYLTRPAEYPLVFHGMSGSGKTSVMAKVASKIHIWLNQPPQDPPKPAPAVSSPSPQKSNELSVPSSKNNLDAGSSPRKARKSIFKSRQDNETSHKGFYKPINPNVGALLTETLDKSKSSSFTSGKRGKSPNLSPEDGHAKVKESISLPSSPPVQLTVPGAAGDTGAPSLSEAIQASPTAVIMRFLGTTSQSCSIRLVLGSICWHLASLRGQDTSSIPGDYPSLVTCFHSMLKQTQRSHPVVLILDSLDQLSPAHRAHNLSWLPRTLPPYVHIVLSTLPIEHGLLDTLKVLIPPASNFIEIKSLGQDLSVELVRDWLKNSGRDLTLAQYHVIREALAQCSLPLYVRLVYEEVSRWSSYAPADSTHLEFTVKGIINKLLDRLERYQGKIFVSHALAYLTASKNGLSSVELEDVLSLDEFVLNDVFQHWLPPIRRIPPLLLPRLYDQLTSYIMLREANGAVVYYWYHNQFIHVARERYLSQNHHRIYIHGILSHYYLGTWGGGKGKAFKYSEKHLQLMSVRINKVAECKADRKVPLQPLHFGVDPNDPTSVNYNLRKLSELPYHLTESRQFFDLKQEVLLNYSFLHAKLTAMSIHDILADFRMAMQAGVKDPEVQLVYSALRVCGNYVNQNSDTLAFDLLGRLLVYYNDKLSIRNLLQQCDLKSTAHSSLLPLHQCFESPRAMLMYVLEEHDQSVVDLVFAKHDLISISRDGVMMFWDLSVGEFTMSIKIPGAGRHLLGMNTKLYTSSDNKYLVVDSDVINSPIYVYDIKTAQLLHRCGRRSPTTRRGFLVGHLMFRQKTIIDISRGVVVGEIDKFLTSKKFALCTITPDQKSLLIGDDKEIRMFNLDDGIIIAKFPSENPPSVFHITEDCRRCYVGYADDCLFKVLDIDRNSNTLGEALLVFNYRNSLATSQYRLLEGTKYNQDISEIAVSPVKNDDVLLNIRRCNLVCLNIETGEAKMLDVKAAYDGRTFKPNEVNFFGVSYSFDGKKIIAGEDCYIHVWDLVTMKFLSTIQLHTNSPFPFAVSRTRDIMASGSSMHTSIKIWDLGRLELKDSIGIKTYENPLDVITVAPQPRFIYIKKYYTMSSNKGYQYVDSFGIDIWNVSTGNNAQFLAFNRFGRLLQMEVSRDGSQMALLLSVKDTYISVLNTRLGKITCTVDAPACTSFIPSVKWDFILTEHSDNELNEIRLWNLGRQGEHVVRFSQVHSPVFTLDGNYLLFIDSFQMLITYSLVKQAPAQFMPIKANNLIPLPVHHSHVLTQNTPQTTTEETKPSTQAERDVNAAVWDIEECRMVCSLQGVSATGIKDISKDGRLAVDGSLQVFDLSTGQLVRKLLEKTKKEANSTSSQTKTDTIQKIEKGSSTNIAEIGMDSTENKEWMFIRFTYDGLYVIHVDDLAVQVSSVETGRLVAHATTHERVTSLMLMDFGYVLVLGREDGRLLMMKLVHLKSTHAQHFPLTVDARSDFVLQGMSGCQDELIETFDVLYRNPSQQLKDSDMPKCSEAIRSVLSSRARVPRAVIKTPKPPSTSSTGTSATLLAAGIAGTTFGGLQKFVRQSTVQSSGPGSVDYSTDGDPVSPTGSNTMKSSLYIELYRSKLKDHENKYQTNGITEHIENKDPKSPSSMPNSPKLGRQKSKDRGPRSPSVGRGFGSTIQSYFSPVGAYLTPLFRRLSPRTATPPPSEDDPGTSVSPVTDQPPPQFSIRSVSSDTGCQADEETSDQERQTPPQSPKSPKSPKSPQNKGGSLPRYVITDSTSSPPPDSPQGGPFSNFFSSLTKRKGYKLARSQPVRSQSSDSQNISRQSSENQSIDLQRTTTDPPSLRQVSEDPSVFSESDSQPPPLSLRKSSSAPVSPKSEGRKTRPHTANNSIRSGGGNILKTLRDLTPVRKKNRNGKPPSGKSVSSEKEGNEVT